MSDVETIPFVEIIGFRRELTRLAESLSQGRHPPASAAVAINRRLAGDAGHEQLIRTAGVWQLRFTPDRVPTALEAIARSAAASLADRVRSVRQCAADPCSLFFLDASATQSRRWCSPAECGGRGRIERRRGLVR